MARRQGRKGTWLVSDDYTGFVVYASKVKKDFWGALAVNPLERNLQEIASPLHDPEPVSYYRGPNYEFTPKCIAENAPLFVGLTTVRTNPNNAAFQALNLDPGIGDAIIGCSFEVN